MFTYFTDRDGKYQLCSLAEIGFDPLARTCKFMLTEEAHHMFVGESGVGRVIQRTCDVMNQLKTDDVAKIRAAGVIDLPTIQRYLNFHFSVTMDLFGADVSSNAATFYTTGLKGRYEETKQTDDHLLNDASYGVLEVNDGKLVTIQAPYLNAINEKLRDDYVTDAKAGIERWNIRRQDLAGRPGGLGSRMDAPASGNWLPSVEDRAFVASLMGRVAEPGKFANWIAPPARGINNQPVDFEYVRFN
jgi:benzoyl-CoA 2,3-dioxygenase component B